jgi:hypothetical protein
MVRNPELGAAVRAALEAQGFGVKATEELTAVTSKDGETVHVITSEIFWRNDLRSEAMLMGFAAALMVLEGFVPPAEFWEGID